MNHQLNYLTYFGSQALDAKRQKPWETFSQPLKQTEEHPLRKWISRMKVGGYGQHFINYCRPIISRFLNGK
jgi:hypothetical protein